MRAVMIGIDHSLEETIVSGLEGLQGVEILGIAAMGRQGVRLAKRLVPDLVVVAFDMPDMTGPAVTRALKSDGIPSPAVIIVSPSDRGGYAHLARQSGADAYLTRASLGQLVAVVEKLKRQREWPPQQPAALRPWKRS